MIAYKYGYEKQKTRTVHITFVFFDVVKTIQILNVLTLRGVSGFRIVDNRIGAKENAYTHASCFRSPKATKLCFPLIINMPSDKDRSWHRPCYTEDRMLAHTIVWTDLVFFWSQILCNDLTMW